MSRLSPYLLLTFLALAGLQGAGVVSAERLSAPSAPALHSDDQDQDTDKYNRKLHKLEIKRAKDRQKLEAEHLKLFRRKESMDLRELQKRLDKIQLKREKLEEKYRRQLQKLESERARRG